MKLALAVLDSSSSAKLALAAFLSPPLRSSPSSSYEHVERRIHRTPLAFCPRRTRSLNRMTAVGGETPVYKVRNTPSSCFGVASVYLGRVLRVAPANYFLDISLVMSASPSLPSSFSVRIENVSQTVSDCLSCRRATHRKLMPFPVTTSDIQKLFQDRIGTCA